MDSAVQNILLNMGVEDEAAYKEILEVWVGNRKLQITPDDAHFWRQMEELLGRLVRLEREGY